MARKIRAAFHGSTAFDALRRDLAAANSHPLAAFLSFEGGDALGVGPDWAGAVAAVEDEGSRLIGAVPCSEVHGRGGLFPHEDYLVPAHDGPCPSCGAAL